MAGAITPVPGGVGPMTIACLLLNTLQAACAQHGLPRRRFNRWRDALSPRWFCGACRRGFEFAGEVAAVSLPGVGDLIERLGAELLRRARDRAAAERAIEFHRRLVVGQRPDHEALQAALHQILARGGEQSAAEAEPLEFRTQIKLVDFAVIEQAARAVAAVIGVAGDRLAELQDGDAAAFADGADPTSPVRGG